MGWFHDDMPHHEGYIVGLVALEGSSYRTRELGSRDDDSDQAVERIQVACSCGWRSAIVRAPLGTEFFPSIVTFRKTDEERIEDRARLEWNAHIDRERARFTGRYYGPQTVDWLHEDYCYGCNGRREILGGKGRMIPCDRCAGTGRSMTRGEALDELERRERLARRSRSHGGAS